MYIILIAFSILLRCMMLGPRSVPRSCARFYDDNSAHYNGSTIYGGIIARDLDNLLSDGTSMTSTHDVQDLCAELIHNYFCYYYYPLCDIETGEIIPVCTESCNLLYNSDVCSDLLISALSMLRRGRYPVPDEDDVCERGFLPFPNTSDPSLVDYCENIEGCYIITVMLLCSLVTMNVFNIRT